MLDTCMKEIRFGREIPYILFSFQVTNALNLSQIVLKHGTDVEILSMKNLIQSQLKQVAEYSPAEKLLAAVEIAIRNASWDLSPEHQKQDNCFQESLKLPEVKEPEEQKGVYIG